MKITALLGAGALAIATLAGTVAPSAADAQRHGWHDRHDGYRDGHRRGWRGDRGYRRGYGYRGGGRGWRGDGYRRGRVVCRVRRGYYGPVRNCVRR